MNRSRTFSSRFPGIRRAARGLRAGLLLLGLAAPAAGVRAQGGGPPAEEGKFGHVYPQSGDVRFGDALVHQDVEGGSNQTLFALSGAEGGGFAAVWRDQRDGMIGLYLARLDPELALREPERPIHMPHSGRRRDPAVALQPKGAGVAVWVSDVSAHAMAWSRAFDARGAFTGADQPLVPWPEAGAPRPARDAGLSRPALAPRKNGGFFVAWSAGGRLEMTTTSADGVPSDGELRPVTIRTPEPVAAGVVLASGPRGTLGWFESAGSGWVFDPARPDAAPRKLGPELPLRAVADPRGGFWLLLRAGDQIVLRHVSDDGRPERELVRPVAEPVASADLVIAGTTIALLCELGTARDPAARGGRGAETARPAGHASFRLQLLDLDGAPLTDPVIDFLPPDSTAASGARIASDGKLVCVAWTEARLRLDPDVWARTIDLSGPERRVGPLRRLNTDQASADQTHARVASAGERALVLWQDHRSGRPQTFVRRLGPEGFAADEQRVPVAVEGDTVPAEPGDAVSGGEVALRADGAHLVTWIHQRGAQRWLRAQAFAADGAALAAPITIEELVPDTPAGSAVAALAEERGWLVLYPRGEQGRLWTRRVSPAGALGGEALAVGEAIEAHAANPALALLDDQRLIAAWDLDPRRGEERRFVRARFLDPDGAPKGEELGFESSARGVDWDPAVAPAGRNGFLIGWTSGLDPGRDVVARLYDARGKEAGPLLPISVLGSEQDFPEVARLADGGFAIAWEDDISGYDHTLIRKIAADGRSLGATVRINELPTTVVEDRVAPVVAALGKGVVTAWGDRRRSKGWDVYLRVLGPRFDAPAKR